MPDIFDTIAIPKKDIFDKISLSKKRDIFDTLGVPTPQPLPEPTEQEKLAKESTDYGFNLLTGTASEAGKEAFKLGRKTFEPFVAMPYQAGKSITDPIAEALRQKTLKSAGRVPSQIENNLVDLALGAAESMGRPLGFSGYELFKESWITDPYGSALAISPIVAPLIFSGAQKIAARIPKKEPVISPEAKQAYTAGIQEIGQTLKNIPDEVRPQQARVVADLRNQMRSALFKNDVSTINSIVADFREGQTIPTAQVPKPTLNIPEINATTLREKQAKELARQKTIIPETPEYHAEMAKLLQEQEVPGFNFGENIPAKVPQGLLEAARPAENIFTQGEVMPGAEHGAVIPPATITIGAKVRIGKSPQVWTITKTHESTPEEIELGEQYFDAKNDKTGEVAQNVQFIDIKPLKGKPAIVQPEGGIVKPQPKGFTPIEAAPVVSKEPWQMNSDEAWKMVKQKAFTPANKNYQIGDIGTFYRSGEIPESGKSYNYRDKYYEKGVSVYQQPLATSFAGLQGKEWYTGKGKIIDFGSDGEPIIKPMGKWEKLSVSGQPDAFMSWHYKQVKNAQSEGKPVPPEVLKDYPDLQQKVKYTQPKLLEGEKTNIAPKMEADIQGQQKMFGKPDIFDKLEFNPEQGFRRQPLTPEAQKEIIKKSDIVKFLQQKLDVPIRYGRFRGKALGIFKVKPEVIRTKFANDIETASHEIGHALQKYLFPESLTKQGLSGKIFQEYQKELLSIASKPKAGQAKTPEGFAEFIRLYITNEPQARAKVPNFYNYFDNYLKTNQPEVKEIFAEARDRYNRYLTQTPEQRKISQISIGEKQPKTKEPLKEFYTKFLDELYPLRDVVQEMTGGEEIPVVKDPYKLARLMPGIAGKVDSFLEYKPFDYKTYKFYGKSLKEILSQIPKDRLDLYRAYQISKSEYESYQKKGIIADPISIEDAKFIIDKYDAEFGKVFKENIAFRDAVLRYFKDSGMLSTDTYNTFKELYENYVPLYRVMDTERTGGTGKPLEAYQFIKQRRGSWRDFIDPIESDIKNLFAMITIAEKNGVTTALVDLANSKHGMGKYVEKIPPPMQKIMVKTDEIINQLSADPMFVEMIKEFPGLSEVVFIFRKSAFTPKENVISNWRNGNQSLYQVHPDIARTIQALDKESVNAVIKMLSYPARWLRAGAVLSPEFIGRNPIRDQFSAFIYSKYGFVPGYDLIKGIFHLAKKDSTYWNWKISGAEHAMLVSVDREYLQKTANAIVENKKIFNIEHVKDIIKNPIEALRALSEISESGTRIGEFARGIKKEGVNKAGILEGGYSSREVSLDFGKSGAYSKSINMIIAFWNAHNQGIDKTVRAFKDNPYTTTWKVAASITLPSIILTLVNSQDERWEEIPRWQKDLFWIIMTKNHIWRIPKPFELGILFGTVPERITEYIISQDKNAFKDVYKSILQGLSPSVLPTVAVPIVENWANRSIFLDRPIVPEGKTNLPPQYQYQPYTTGVAKTLGRLISKIPKLGDTAIASPAKIENLIRGWTGGLGVHALKVSDYVLKKAGVIDESIMPRKTMVDIPFIKAFAVRYPSADANSIQEFYDRYETNSQRLNAVKQLLKEGKIEEAKRLQGKGIVKDGMTYKALNNMNQTISNIYMNKNISPEEKRNLIDSIYLQMIAITKHANKQLPQIGR